MQRKNLFDEAEQARAEMIVQEITDRGMQIRINGTWYTAVELQGGRVDFTPVYGLCSNIAQLIVLAYGIHLILIGDFTLGLLISFLTYMNRFYDPLRQLASLWANFQVALAGWDRISDILALQSDLVVVRPGPWAEKPEPTSSSVMSFQDVSFHYPDGKEVLKHITFNLEPGKTYALGSNRWWQDDDGFAYGAFI